MEVNFTPDVQAELEQMARDMGRASDELVAQTREMLDRRCDDLENGRVQLIDGEEAYRRLVEKTESQTPWLARGRTPGNRYRPCEP
jgi:hypothetical protein